MWNIEKGRDVDDSDVSYKKFWNDFEKFYQSGVPLFAVLYNWRPGSINLAHPKSVNLHE